jgi:hypothetical protein
MYPIQRPKLGFLIKDVSSSELAYNILKNGSNIDDVDTFVFFESIARPCISTLVPCAHIAEAYTFDGPLIATCLQTAYKLIQMFSSKNKFFFLNDLEWMRIDFRAKQFSHIEPIYRNKELSLICRSEAHKTITELTWGRKITVIENYNFYSPDVLNKLNINNGIYPLSPQQPIKFKNSIL